MSQQRYSIVIQTPLGKKNGMLTASISGNLLRGWLYVLQHKEPFEGTIDAEGNCELCGKIITLMRTINYKATGKITPDSLKLSITDNRHVLEIIGTPCRT
jgi:hypothetical protein